VVLAITDRSNQPFVSRLSHVVSEKSKERSLPNS